MKFTLKSMFVGITILAVMFAGWRMMFAPRIYCYQAADGKIHYVVRGRYVMMPGSGWSSIDGVLQGHPTTMSDFSDGDVWYDNVEVLEAKRVEDGNWVVLRMTQWEKQNGYGPTWTIWADEFYKEVINGAFDRK